MASTSLNAARRDTELAELAAGNRVDVLVVGGGVTGSAAALDAAARGMSVALVESVDLGRAACSAEFADDEIAHLLRGELGQARRISWERSLMLRHTASHLVRTSLRLIPLGERVSRGEETGLAAASHGSDALRRAARTPISVLPPSRRVPAAEARALAPGLRVTGLRGGLLTFDARPIDEARLAVALARTAAGLGAKIITRAHAGSVRSDGAEIHDARSDSTIRVSARAVVIAAGAGTRQLVGHRAIRVCRTSDLLLDAGPTGLSSTGIISPVPGDSGRFVCCFPRYGGYVRVGVIEAPVLGGHPRNLAPNRSDVDELLSSAGTVLGRPLGRADVLGTRTGLRALPTARSRRRPARRGGHSVLTGPDGVVTVVGGTPLAYRVAAAEAVDTASRERDLGAGPSRTAEVPLVGAPGADRADRIEAEPRLIARYGTEAPRVAAAGELDADLAEPVITEAPTTVAEVLWAVRHEGALDTEDVVDRRTPLGRVDTHRAAAYEPVAALVRRALRGVEL